MDDDAEEFPDLAAIQKEYNLDTSIENYVRLRRKHPDVELDISNTGGLDFVFLRDEELKANRIEPRLVVHCLDADPIAHRELSLLLMERMLERKNLEKAGKSHIVSLKKAISDLLVNNLIAVMLDSLDWNGELEICPDLIVLIKYQLGMNESQYQLEQKRKENQNKAIWIVVELLRINQKPTLRKIAKLMNVDATTIMRWLGDGDWLQRANAFRSISDEIRKNRLQDKNES